MTVENCPILTDNRDSGVPALSCVQLRSVSEPVSPSSLPPLSPSAQPAVSGADNTQHTLVHKTQNPITWCMHKNLRRVCLIRVKFSITKTHSREVLVVHYTTLILSTNPTINFCNLTVRVFRGPFLLTDMFVEITMPQVYRLDAKKAQF